MFSSLKLDTIILTLILAYYSKAQSNHQNDICANITSYPPLTSPSTYPNISKTLTSYTSTDCVDVYQLDLNSSTYKGNYVLIEIKYLDFLSDPTFIPFLVGKFGSTPGLNVIHQPDEFDQQDKPDSAGRKPYQYIEFLTHDTAAGGMYYIALYRYNVDPSTYYNKSLTYTINVHTSSSYICPRDCFSSQNQGTCDPQNLKCDCSTGYFDTDCSVSATLIDTSGAANFNIPPGEWIYFYLPNRHDEDNVHFVFTEYLASVTAVYQYSSPSSNLLPSANFTAIGLEIDMDTIDNIAKFSDNEGFAGQFVIGFYNNDNINNVKLSYEIQNLSSSSWVVPIIIWSLMGGSFLLFCLCIVRTPGISPRHRRNVILIQTRISQQPHQFLSIDEINEYFP